MKSSNIKAYCLATTLTCVNCGKVNNECMVSNLYVKIQVEEKRVGKEEKVFSSPL